MVQGAVHDAMNAITRRYAAYYFEGPGEAGAAAAAAAAHTVLVGVIPSFGTPAQKIAALALVEDAYVASLHGSGAGAATTQGVAVGRAAGAAMLALRKEDGATKDAPYTPGTGPGKWRPHPNPDPPNPPIANKGLAPGYAPSVLPGWGNVTPFTLRTATSRASRSATCTISGAWSRRSERAPPTATTPPPGTQAGTAVRARAGPSSGARSASVRWRSTCSP
jgi:hypothetical protein